MKLQQEFAKLREELKQELKDTVAQAVKQRTRSNPSVAVRRVREKERLSGGVRHEKATGEGVSDLPQDERDELVDALEEIQVALDRGRLDRAQEIADDILDEYDEEEDEDEDEEED